MNKKIISVIGSGGKSSLILEMARDLKAKNKKVAITTTTKIFRNINNDCVDFVCDNISEKMVITLFSKHKVVIFGEKNSEKLTIPKDNFFEYIMKYCDILLIEADGSKQKPLKITNENEPVIYEKTTEIIAVFGLSSIGKKAEDVCHRYQGTDIVDIDFFCNKILLNIRNIDKNKLKIVLNQADNLVDIENAKKIREKLCFDGIKIAKKGIECEF